MLFFTTKYLVRSPRRYIVNMLLLSISRTAVSFVGAIYSLIGSLLMLCNFVYQIMLISQNVTSLEKNILCVKNNIEKQLSNTQIKK
jgi:uncharacterized membrane protein YgaE (UPF0421/DUF939 family)